MVATTSYDGPIQGRSVIGSSESLIGSNFLHPYQQQHQTRTLLGTNTSTYYFVLFVVSGDNRASSYSGGICKKGQKSHIHISF